MKKPAFLILPLLIIAAAAVQPLTDTSGRGADALFQGFQDPPRKYSPEPFWFWNGKMEGEKVAEQVRQMVDQHVFGAFLHARDGLETPYLSEEWWQAVGGGVAEARRLGFSFDFVDEYDWPSGEVRNVWRTDSHQSEVIARRPEFRQRTLAHREEFVQGPKDVRLTLPPDVQTVAVARWLGGNRIDGASLKTITPAAGGDAFTWAAPPGSWVVSIFSLQPGTGFDGGYVDLLNPEAVKLYISLYYEEFFKRFGADFGKTIRYSFADHEGDDGYRIAWTPALFDEFIKQKGYDLRQALPLLYYEGGKETVKVRCDYIEVVTRLYDTAFWTGVTSWAKAHRLGRTGHGWEDRLAWAAAFHGDLFTIERGLDPVGVDSLLDFGRQPVAFKVTQSVADFEGRRFMCENQGVQGTDSYLDMEGLRRGTNGIGTWGVDLFVPHAVNYNPAKANYPPDWLHQPYWPYFHHYADYVRRISYMNGESRRVVNLAVYYPITSVWAHADSVFTNATNYQEIMNMRQWNGTVNLIEDYNTRLMLELTARCWDYSYLDDHYLDRARLDGRELVIGEQRFGAVILPPLTTIRRPALKKLTDFYRAGGQVLAVRRLPESSPEAGGGDPEIIKGVEGLFGGSAGHSPLEFTASENANGGRAVFVASEIGTLIDLLEDRLPRDVRVTGGPEGGLLVQHRQKLGHDYYWVVNDTDRPRTNRLLFLTQGKPEKWDALSGETSPLWYTNTPDGTEVSLSFGPWDAGFVVFGSEKTPLQDLRLVSSNAEKLDLVSREPGTVTVHVVTPATADRIEIRLGAGKEDYRGAVAAGGLAPIALSNEWQFRPEPDRVAVPYARVKDAAAEDGAAADWVRPDFDDTAWPEVWLSEAQNTMRNWNMIGPFSNDDDAGFAAAYPPETEFRTDIEYPGAAGEMVAWKRYYGDVPRYEEGAFNIWATTTGGPFADGAHIAQFARLLPVQGKDWIVCYAQCQIYSPEGRTANIVLAADNAARLWLNGQKVYERLRHPFWYEMNDNWADTIPVELRRGWNPVLIKVGLGRFAASGYYGFTFRVADTAGRTIPGIVGSFEPYDIAAAPARPEGLRFYRIEVPPGCVAVIPPGLRRPFRMFLNGAEVESAGGGAVDIRDRLTQRKNVLAVVARRDDRLSMAVEFVSGFRPFRLKPWTQTGLANFSGTAVYEQEFSVPESYAGKKLILDCGRVSSVAEVAVNGRRAGAAVWRPYRVDITELARPGANRLTIRLTNTEANRRAVGTYRRILKNIDVDGLEGPVEIVPYLDAVVDCRLSREK
jgi:Glycosyl hydrolase 2 galactose-binding domain-like/alpha-L-rhamnosidase